MKENISGGPHFHWEASTLINSTKFVAENVVGFVDIRKIGEDSVDELRAL